MPPALAGELGCLLNGGDQVAVYGFLNSALVHHQPSPSTPVL